jgi:hypothetical protein
VEDCQPDGQPVVIPLIRDAELPDLATEITNGTFRTDARAVPLADIETAWKDTDGSQRIVITPNWAARSQQLSSNATGPWRICAM